MAGGKVHDFSGFTLSVCQLRPESTGSIELAYGRSIRAAKNPRQLSCRRNRPALHHGGNRLCAQARGDPPFADYVAAEVQPGPDYATDADLLAFARKNGATIFHPAGTCRMGVDDEAVVDPRLRLRGIDALWVADCSIMPKLVSGNTNVPAIMIGEKASDMILEDVSRG